MIETRSIELAVERLNDCTDNDTGAESARHPLERRVHDPSTKVHVLLLRPRGRSGGLLLELRQDLTQHVRVLLDGVDDTLTSLCHSVSP